MSASESRFTDPARNAPTRPEDVARDFLEAIRSEDATGPEAEVFARARRGFAREAGPSFQVEDVEECPCLRRQSVRPCQRAASSPWRVYGIQVRGTTVTLD